MKIFARIRFYYSAFVIAATVSIMIIALKLFPKYKGKIIHIGNIIMMRGMLAKTDVIGEPDKKAGLYLINHQGIVDIITIEAILDKNLNWVAKKELFEIPWFGRLLKYGEMISVDREDRKGLIKLLKDIKYSLEILHRSVAIFPEGTRANDQKLLPFKDGARFIAEKFGLVVQPVVIVGSKSIVNEHDQTSLGGSDKVIFLPSIDVKDADKEWYTRLQTEMQNIIDEQLTVYNISR